MAARRAFPICRASDAAVSDTLSPTSAADVLAAVQDAFAQEQPLEIVGGGTKRGWGRPVESNRVLDLSGLSGVTLYEPEELVLSAKAGTPMAEIEALLASDKQMLAFEPPDLAGIYGLAPPAGAGAPQGKALIHEALPSGAIRAYPRQTLGGVIACNLSGPRRIKAGAARDHFLGFHAVNGRGEAFKAGGRVMKNVTGYDLPKLLCGSFGTLAVMTEITVKVLPAPEKARTVLLLGLDDTEARDAMAAALNSPHEVSGAAHLPRNVAARSAVGYVRGAGEAVTALRVEGFGPSVEARCQALRELLGAASPKGIQELHSMNSSTLWREIRDVAPLLPESSLDLWRLAVPPACGAPIMASLAMGEGFANDGYFYDWGGGQIWLAAPQASPAATAAAVRALVTPTAGHATLVRAPKQTRESISAFHPQVKSLAALAEQLRKSLDPAGIFNPARLA
jgi:glycolate oxidase FAD binding subunit